MTLNFGENSDDVNIYSAELQQLLFGRPQGAAGDIANGGGDGHFLDPHRQIKRRYGPRTAGTKRAVLRQLISVRSAGHVDEVEQMVRHMEELFKSYETLSGASLPEDLNVIVLIHLCSNEFGGIKEQLV